MIHKTIFVLSILWPALSWAQGSPPPAPPVVPPPPQQALPSKKVTPAKEKTPKDLQNSKKLERFHAAVKVLESSRDNGELVRALKVLRDGMPDSRPVLHESLGSASKAVRCFALEILREHGKAEKDLEAVARCLNDDQVKVRLAAVMAIRRLGTTGLPALLAYLPGEQDANNRKMAIKTLQQWRDRKAVPVLVQLLKEEKEKGVRNFAIVALEVLSDRSYGEDLEAWQKYAEDLLVQEQAQKLLGKGTENKETQP